MYFNLLCILNRAGETRIIFVSIWKIYSFVPDQFMVRSEFVGILTEFQNQNYQ